MGQEIEKKFLINYPMLEATGLLTNGVNIQQGYLCTETTRTVRVRLKGEKAFLTIKGETKGITRSEFEYPIPVEDAMALLRLCEGYQIDKTRYVVVFEGMKWEIDIFHGENEGLYIAEIELETEDQGFIEPEWLLKEVSEEPQYYNSNLTNHPFKEWE